MFRRLAVGVLGTGAAVSLMSCTYVVDPGTAVVKFDRFRGVIPQIYEEGLRFLVPVIQKKFVYDIRTRLCTITTQSGTKDLQGVNVCLRVLFRPEKSKLPHIHQSLGQGYDQVVLPNIGNEILKAVVARFNAEELLTRREEVSRSIGEIMRERAYREFSIIVDDVALMDISFGEEFARAVELKQVAQQEVERYKFIVLRNEHDRNANIIKAEGEANAANCISKALAKYGPALVELRRIEASKQIAEVLSEAPNGAITYVPKGMNLFVKGAM